MIYKKIVKLNSPARNLKLAIVASVLPAIIFAKPEQRTFQLNKALCSCLKIG